MERADLGRLFALSSPTEPTSCLGPSGFDHGRKGERIIAAEQRRADKFGAFLDSLGGR